MVTTVGVLALQGDFARHEVALAGSGFASRRVRRPADLIGLDGLVLPGGESTTMLRLCAAQDLTESLGAFLRSGAPVLATCAGLILCAREVHPRQPSFGVLDVVVTRNGYGRQIHSGTVALEGCLPEPMAGVFIRAPRILVCGPGVEILARRHDDPVLVRQGSVIGACFHPELQDNHVVSRLFADLVVGSRVRGRLDHATATR
jgi:5'-phosphate synthase pdxT subunit